MTSFRAFLQDMVMGNIWRKNLTCALIGLALATFFPSRSAWAAASDHFNLFKTQKTPISPSAKIFLLAGSSQNANFAQEVADQRAMWLREGYAEEEIACYYVVPNRKEFKDDEEQWRSLLADLEACYPASVALLREHLRAASRPEKDFLYLFFTSHGQRPISLRLKNRDPDDKGYAELAKLAKYPVMDQYHLAVEGLPQGTAETPDLLKAMEQGRDEREVFLTPRYLRDFLQIYYGKVPKFIVLQGCYTGGFLKDPRKGQKKDNLRELDRVTVLTAARHDRSSFGCETGGHTTYFGGTFNETLVDFIDPPPKMEWKELFRTVRGRIVEMENEDPDIRPSEPLFFSNN